jgi:hypothetical protein
MYTYLGRKVETISISVTDSKQGIPHMKHAQDHQRDKLDSIRHQLRPHPCDAGACHAPSVVPDWTAFLRPPGPEPPPATRPPRPLTTEGGPRDCPSEPTLSFTATREGLPIVDQLTSVWCRPVAPGTMGGRLSAAESLAQPRHLGLEHRGPYLAVRIRK